MKKKFSLLFVMLLSLSSCGLFSNFIDNVNHIDPDNVEKEKPTKIVVSQSYLEIAKRESKTVTLSLDKEPVDKTIKFKANAAQTWLDTSIEDNILTISVGPSATTNSTGTVTVTYSELRENITVKALDEIQYATAVNLSKTNIELKRNGSTTITASLNGTLREGEEVYTYTSDTNWLIVNQNNNIFTLTVSSDALIGDNATLTINVATFSASATITVLDDDVIIDDKYGDIVDHDYHLVYEDRNKSQEIEKDDSTIDPDNPIKDIDELEETTIDCETYVGKYTKNFAEIAEYPFSFGARTVGNTPNLTLYYADPSYSKIYPSNGAIFNISSKPFMNLSYVRLNFSSYTNAKVFYGKNYTQMFTYTYAAPNEDNLLVFASKPSYIRIEACGSNITLNSLSFYHEGLNSDYTSKQASGEDLTRFNAPEEVELAEGTTVIMPIEYDEVNNKVLKSKEYTYYSFDYVKQHSDLISETTWTDPVDVMNYVQAFNTYPNNYAYSSDLSLVSTYYGSKNVRQVSSYNRTDGYVNAVPYHYGDYYYELDVDLDGTYGSGGRGVGRIVWFKTGFNYDDDKGVCVYTDDHYYSFIEYYNNGTFSYRFDAQSNWVQGFYSAPNSINFF